jgi:hypothetical protein
VEQKPEEIDVVEDMGVDAWNKMLEAAEAEAMKEEELRKARANLTEVIEPEAKFQSYVQNEEQGTSNVWNKTVAPISNLEYQQATNEAHIKELIDKIENGTADVENLSDADKKAIADYLARNQ